MLELFKKYGATLLLVVVACGVTWFLGNRNDPDPLPVPLDPTIVGVDRVVPKGDLVRLELRPFTMAPSNLRSYQVKWVVLEDFKPKEVVDGGANTVFFGAGNQDKNLQVVCSVVYVFKDKVENVVLNRKLVIGNNPGPDPGPGPTPNPDPVFPPGKYNLSKTVYDLSKSVKSPSKEQDAKTLALSFTTVSSQIGAGVLTDLKVILETTKKSNQIMLGANNSYWQDFGVSLQDRLYSLYEGKQMTSREDFRLAWLEIAAGLEKVK